MALHVDLEDLVDGTVVAGLIGLDRPGGLAAYRARYDDFPGAMWESSDGRYELWLRAEVEEWVALRRRAEASVPLSGRRAERRRGVPTRVRRLPSRRR
jgi:hypothetical protein